MSCKTGFVITCMLILKPISAYRAAHSEALRIAKDANGDEGQLKVAYLHDAFGLHYLSDQFAAGHTRCPRVEMNWPSLAGVSELVATYST